MSFMLCLILFGSGAAGLIFETIWFHQAGLAFGNSVWASSLVLSGFMTGLGLGSLLVCRFGDDLRRPMRAYAWLELTIAVTGVVVGIFLPRLSPILAPLLGGLADQPWLLNPLRLGLVFLFLLVPSTAMGATLPVMVKALVAVDRNFGRSLGRLYGWNTLGAVAGSLLAAGPLVAAFGIRGACLMAAGLNGLAALAAVVVAHRWAASTDVVQADRFSTLSAFALLRRPAAIAVLLSGFLLLALEVVWFRFLLLFVPGTSMAFGWLLAVVLVGIGLGGLSASAILARFSAFRFAATGLSLVAGAVCLFGYRVFLPLVQTVGSGHVDDTQRTLVLALVLMLPTCLASGAFFVLAGAQLKEATASVATAAGVLTFANTVGAALGSLFAGFVLLPRMGTEASLVALGGGYAVVGLLLWGSAAGRWRGTAVAAGGLWVAALIVFPYGMMQRDYLALVVERRDRGMEQVVLAVKEGLTETLAYVEDRSFGRPYFHTLMTNGFGMSGTHWFGRRYMKLYVYLPVALHPDLESALLISYGVGSTAKALTDTAGLKRIDVVDISREILEMNRILYPDSSEFPLDDPRVEVHVEDGRYFLQSTAERYDLITAEPPPPALAGVVNLYTREYFELIRQRLNDGGMVTYWLPMHALSDRGARSIVRAFCDAFVDCTLWASATDDLMLMGTRDAQGPVTEEAFARQWSDRRVSPELLALGFEFPEQLGALFIGDADYLGEVAADAPPLNDDFPRRIVAVDDDSSADGLLESLLDVDRARRLFERSPAIDRLWPAELRQRSLPYFDYQRMINRIGCSFYRNPMTRMVDLYRVQTRTELRTLPVWIMGSDATLQRLATEAAGAELLPPTTRFHLAVGAIASREFERGARLLTTELKQNAEDFPALMLQVYALGMAGRFESLERQLEVHTAEFDQLAPGYVAWLRETFGG